MACAPPGMRVFSVCLQCVFWNMVAVSVHHTAGEGCGLTSCGLLWSHAGCICIVCQQLCDKLLCRASHVRWQVVLAISSAQSLPYRNALGCGKERVKSVENFGGSSAIATFSGEEYGFRR